MSPSLLTTMSFFWGFLLMSMPFSSIVMRKVSSIAEQSSQMAGEVREIGKSFSSVAILLRKALLSSFFCRNRVSLLFLTLSCSFLTMTFLSSTQSMDFFTSCSAVLRTKSIKMRKFQWQFLSTSSSFDANLRTRAWSKTSNSVSSDAKTTQMLSCIAKIFGLCFCMSIDQNKLTQRVCVLKSGWKRGKSRP